MHARPEGGAEDDRAGVATVRAVADLGGLVHDLVVGGMDVVGELDLGHRSHAVQGGADGHASDAELGQGRVDDALLAEAPLEAVGGAEDTAVEAHVLAQDDHGRVRFHLLEQRLADGLDQIQLGHRDHPDRSCAFRSAMRRSA